MSSSAGKLDSMIADKGFSFDGIVWGVSWPVSRVTRFEVLLFGLERAGLLQYHC